MIKKNQLSLCSFFRASNDVSVLRDWLTPWSALRFETMSFLLCSVFAQIVNLTRPPVYVRSTCRTFVSCFVAVTCCLQRVTQVCHDDYVRWVVSTASGLPCHAASKQRYAHSNTINSCSAGMDVCPWWHGLLFVWSGLGVASETRSVLISLTHVNYYDCHLSLLYPEFQYLVWTRLQGNSYNSNAMPNCLGGMRCLWWRILDMLLCF